MKSIDQRNKILIIAIEVLLVRFNCVIVVPGDSHPGISLRVPPLIIALVHGPAVGHFVTFIALQRKFFFVYFQSRT